METCELKEAVLLSWLMDVFLALQPYLHVPLVFALQAGSPG